MGVKNPTNSSIDSRKDRRKWHTLLIPQRMASYAPRKEEIGDSRIKARTKRSPLATTSGFLHIWGGDGVGFDSSSLLVANDWWFFARSHSLSRSEFVEGRKEKEEKSDGKSVGLVREKWKEKSK